MHVESVGPTLRVLDIVPKIMMLDAKHGPGPFNVWVFLPRPESVW